MKYVDGYVLPVMKKNLKAYQAMALKAAKVWIDHGALEVKECVGEDLASPMAISFAQNLHLKKGETAVFSYIVYKSRAQRDKINAKVFKDPRMTNMMGMKKMPFDFKRMVHGGFKTIVDL